MFKQLLLTAAFFTLALGAALAAEPASLSGDELRKAVSGKTVYLKFPDSSELPSAEDDESAPWGGPFSVPTSLRKGR